MVQGSWRRPAVLLMLMAAAMQLAFATWWSILNNFAVGAVGFTGREIGIQQSIREIPGLLSFGVVFVLFLMREQILAYAALLLLGLGVAATGYFPTVAGLYATTVLMSFGFHYYETAAHSLSLQWLTKEEAPRVLGRVLGVGAVAQLAAYGFVIVGFSRLGLDYATAFALAGGATLLTAAALWLVFPRFPSPVKQRQDLVVRKRYWLFYALTFMDGARRQIFTVFAGFLMVERFGYSVEGVAGLFLINCLVNMAFAPKIGEAIARWGERRALTAGYVGLALVFTAYAVVSDPLLAAALFVIDNAFFAFGIGLKTYFQKIADPADIAPSAGVTFTINHIAAVAIPVAFGLLWLASPAAVFLAGAAMACMSLILSRLIPSSPGEGRETRIAVRTRVVPAE